MNVHFSKAMKKRHWEVISKTCGFEAMKGDILVIDTMTLEEFAALNLERQIVEIKAIIEKAEKEFQIEKHLSSVKQELFTLSFKYKVTGYSYITVGNPPFLTKTISSF